MGDYAATDGMRIVVILDEDRKILSLGHISNKGLRKSTEQGELWYTHPETGRVLPFENGRLLRIEERDHWVEATVRVSPDRQIPETASAGTGTANGGEAIGTADGIPDGARNESSTQEFPGDTILNELASLIAGRNRERPEGSYTTYLFEQGAEKIRKKTGEEAVELILAGSKDEIVYESADLIYHMLVLFESEGIPLSALIEELSRRRS